MTIILLSVVRVYAKCDDSGSVLHNIIRYHWVESGTVELFRYRGVGSRNVAPRVLVYGIVFAASVWQTGPWFLEARA